MYYIIFILYNINIVILRDVAVEHLLHGNSAAVTVPILVRIRTLILIQVICSIVIIRISLTLAASATDA